MSRQSSLNSWFALSSSALGREAVESKDGYTIISLPSTQNPREMPSDTVLSGGDLVNEGSRQARHFLCWEYVGASICT